MILEGALAAKEKGEKWCTCPACQRGAVLLENREVILN